MRKEYVGYIRVAHKDEYAVESQKMYIENYAKSRNIKIDCYYIDDGYSGRKFERPQLIQMLREVKSRKITKGIIVKDMSRLGRDFGVIYKILSRISRRNIALISTIDGENLENNIILSLIQEHMNDELNRRMMTQKLREQKGAVIESPYKKYSNEDIEFRKKKILELEKQGIYNIRFIYKDDMKKQVGTRDERN